MERKDLSALKIDRGKNQKIGPANRLLYLLTGLLLAAVVVLLALQFYSSGERAAESTQAAVGPAEPVTAADVPPESREVLIASGYVVAHHKISLGSKVTGKVAWIGVEKGDKVEKGQLLVKLEDREFRAQLEEARANLRAAEARLAELERGNRPEEIRRAQAELRRYKADRENARLELSRLQKLLESGVISRQQVDDARARFEMAEAAAQAAERNYELMKIGPRQEQIEQARANRDRALASVEYFATLRDATEIRAPIGGTVLARIAEVGEMITTSFAGETGAKSAVVSLADLNDLQVELDISQSDFNRITPELACDMTPEAYPDRVYRCEIDQIAPEADRQKATIQVKVKVLEPDEFLRPDMSAVVTFSRKGELNHE